MNVHERLDLPRRKWTRTEGAGIAPQLEVLTLPRLEEAILATGAAKSLRTSCASRA